MTGMSETPKVPTVLTVRHSERSREDQEVNSMSEKPTVPTVPTVRHSERPREMHSMSE